MLREPLDRDKSAMGRLPRQRRLRIRSARHCGRCTDVEQFRTQLGPGLR
jgi:hypothetical protein